MVVAFGPFLVFGRLLGRRQSGAGTEMNADADAQRLFQIGLDLRIEQSVACLVWVTSVELGPSVTFPLSPPEADVGADIVLRRLVPIPDVLLEQAERCGAHDL